VPVALFIGWESRGRIRWLAFGCAAVIVAATLLTYSRGGMLALSVILVLALIAHRVDRRRMIGGAVALFALLLLLPASFTRRFVTIEQILPGSEETIHRDSSFEKRRLLTATAWVTFKNNPLLGVGAGNYTVWFDHYAEQVGSEARGYDDPGEAHYPHNLYLEIAAETGLVGLIIFAVIVSVTLAHLRAANRALAEDGLNEAAAVAKAFELAVIGYLISSLFLHGHFQRYLWLMFGLAAALARLTPLVRAEKTVRMATAESL
jgi:O-antigen ligase